MPQSRETFAELCANKLKFFVNLNFAQLGLFGQPNDIEDPTLDVVNKINKFELNLYKQNLNNSPPINLEQKFLKEYKDMGFSLYQANDQLTEWKEVKLNQNNEVQKNPCN